MRKPYNNYDFDPDSPFVPMQHCCGVPNVSVDVDIDSIKDAIDEKLSETFEGFNSNLDEHLDKITCKIKHAEHHIIDEIEEHSMDNQCLCHLATKADIKNAVDTITQNTQQIIDDINFDEQFENLNNQIKELKDNE